MGLKQPEVFERGDIVTAIPSLPIPDYFLKMWQKNIGKLFFVMDVDQGLNYLQLVSSHGETLGSPGARFKIIKKGNPQTKKFMELLVRGEVQAG